MPKSSRCVAVYRQRSNKSKSCKPRKSKSSVAINAIEKKIPNVIEEKYDSPFSVMGREFSHATDTTVAASELPTVEEKYPTLPRQYAQLNENPALRMGNPQPIAITGSKVPTNNPFQQGTLAEIYMDPTLLQTGDPPRNPDGIYPTVVLMRDVNPFEQLGVHTFNPISVPLLANERNIINPYVVLNSGTVLPHTLAPKRVADTPYIPPRPRLAQNAVLLPSETQYKSDPVNRYGPNFTPARPSYLDEIINEDIARDKRGARKQYKKQLIELNIAKLDQRALQHKLKIAQLKNNYHTQRSLRPVLVPKLRQKQVEINEGENFTHIIPARHHLQMGKRKRISLGNTNPTLKIQTLMQQSASNKRKMEYYNDINPKPYQRVKSRR